MNLTRKRLAALAATVSTLAIAVPVVGASAAVSAMPAGLPAVPAGLPYPPVQALQAYAVPPISLPDSSAHVAVVVGPTITGSTLTEGPGAAGQVAAAAPQAIALLSTTAGATIANGTP